jgi:hypothetical protein
MTLKKPKCPPGRDKRLRFLAGSIPAFFCHPFVFASPD